MAAPRVRPRDRRPSLAGIGTFIISRYPYIFAFVLLMLFAERAEQQRSEGYARGYIYSNIAALFVLGTLIIFDWQKHTAYLLCAVQVAIHAFYTHTSPYLHFGEWLTIRIVTRNFAVIGGYLMLASRELENIPRRFKKPLLFTTGRYVYGFFLLCYSYTLFRSKEDNRAFHKLVPLGNLFSFVMVALTAVGAGSFFSGIRLRTAARVLLVVLIVTTLYFEGNINYWWRQRFVEYWMHILILSESIVAIAVLMLLCYH
ncbi:transmembrane protein 101-like [Saccoglossus kowalevskii]|uniref:Transmembrane protein 101-like n=1 Tax=Saccoglossus kowalevskii TaxID=10224 RepID=A0ABM0GLG8_SACKO|nr:PREDICTED: transmembrane protein 101-like [Saccoglossus kowalevskii]